MKNGKTVAPVMGESGPRLLKEALEEHRQGSNKMYAALASDEDFVKLYSTRDAYGKNAFDIAKLNVAGIPTYIHQGWYDYYPETGPLYLQNIKGPIKVAIGPWTHHPDETDDPKSQAHEVFWKTESLRWHDYWLKGIDNGVTKEPPLFYSIIDQGTDRGAWKSAYQWPDPNVQRQDYFMSHQTGPHKLTTKDDSTIESKASFTVDYTATTGKSARMWDSSGGTVSGLHYPELTQLNSKGIFYTSAVLKKDLAVVGAPVIRLNLTSTHPDMQVNVFLEKVLPNGSSIFVTEGVMMASWRALAKPPYDNLGLPYLDGREQTIKNTPPLNAGIATIELDLNPVGMLFEKGSRIRVAITGADADNYYQDPIYPPPKVTLVSGGMNPSKISLPILNPGKELTFDHWVYSP